MLKIGITGGIGAGKSLICTLFELLEVPTYNADARAKYLQVHDKRLQAEIRNLFGDKAYLEDGDLNRPYISKIVFQDEKILEKLNNLVHPAVGRDFSQWCDQHQDKAFILKEAALLFESGSYKKLDCVINVHAEKSIRMARTLKRDSNRTEESVEAIMKKQFSDQKRNDLADFIIKNDESESVILQVNKLFKEFEKRSSLPHYPS